jgi:hypothetical protein
VTRAEVVATIFLLIVITYLAWGLFPAIAR